jgi:hypothetical protein
MFWTAILLIHMVDPSWSRNCTVVMIVSGPYDFLGGLMNSSGIS